MVYVRDVERSLGFYRDGLGFELIEAFREGGGLVYARLRRGARGTTLALHRARPGASVRSPGMRLYFEVAALDTYCRGLADRGIRLSGPIRTMPWGWRHAYLTDPDGHELSLYWAGRRRLRPTPASAPRPRSRPGQR